MGCFSVSYNSLDRTLISDYTRALFYIFAASSCCASGYSKRSSNSSGSHRAGRVSKCHSYPIHAVCHCLLCLCRSVTPYRWMSLRTIIHCHRLSEVHQDAIRAAVKILTLENTYIPTRLKDGQQGAAVSSSGRGSRPQQPKSLTSYPTMPQGMRGGGKPMQPRGEGAGGRGYVQTGGGYGGGRGGDRNGDRNRRGAPPPPRAPGEYSNRG